MNSISGKCLCGKVQVAIDTKNKIFDACHCGMCRRWSGGPIMTIQAGQKIEIKGKEFVQIYESSDWAQRSFCKNCGTHLYYHLKNTDHYNFPLGIFENVDDFKFHVQIFIDAKPKNYEFANKTEMMTEAEVIAKFGST